MATIMELTAQIVAAHASSNAMTQDELLQELEKVHASLKALESGEALPTAETKEEAQAPTLSYKQSIKKNEIICLVCGKAGFKTLTRHLKQAHELKPGQYRKQFGIPSSQPLSAKSSTEARKKLAESRNMSDVLAKAREARLANLAKKAKPAKAAKPAKPKAKSAAKKAK